MSRTRATLLSGISKYVDGPAPSTMFGVRAIRKLGRPKVWIILIVASLIVLSWIPLALGFRARVIKSPEPRIHIFQDMDNQPKVKAQDASIVFADGRAMRPPVPGTVARGRLDVDEHLTLGYRRVNGEDGQTAVEWYDTFPDGITVDETFIRRGQQVYNTTCFICHGPDGAGNGPVHQRAVAVGAMGTGWVQPSNLHEDPALTRPAGHIFNTFTNGIRTMGAYGSQIEPRDRWAVVAYVRALQLSQSAPPETLSAEQQEKLR